MGVLVGHTPVRLYVMGEAATERAATADEIAAMRRIVREAIESGAVGFATSKSPTHVGYQGRPVPSRAAELEEIGALAAELGALDKGVMQATFGSSLFLDEFADIARKIRRPISWTALLSGTQGPGCAPQRPREDRGTAARRSADCSPGDRSAAQLRV